MHNTFGHLFQITTFGESHGPGIGVIIDGCPSLLPISEQEIQKELNRRKPGQSAITTPRKEKDQVQIQSGIFEGKTLGSPISLYIANEDQHSQDYKNIKDLFRPGHADFSYQQKYGTRDWRGGGRSSNRETAARVAAGAIAKKLNLELAGVDVLAWVDQVYNIKAEVNIETVTEKEVEMHITRCPDFMASKKMEEAILKAKEEGDSLGGAVKFRIKNCPAGLGGPVFNKLSSSLANALMSINATKGFELGVGSQVSQYKGSMHNDPIILRNGKIKTLSNHAGGILGGISNGETIYGSLYFKPTATIKKMQKTVDIHQKEIEFQAQGRHDPCVLPRAVPIVEAMLHLCLADHLLQSVSANLPNLKRFFSLPG